MKKTISLILSCILILSAFSFPITTYAASGNTQGNILNGGYVAIQGDWLYYHNWDDGGKLYKAKTDGSNKQKLNNDESISINVIGDWIYYYGSGENYGTYCVKTDGTGLKKISSNSCIQVVDDWIYFNDNDGYDKMYRLFRMKTDGSGKQKLTDTRSVDVSVVNDWIYYYDDSYDIQDLYRMKTDGSGKQKLSVKLGYKGDYGVIGDWIYYSNGDDKYKLYRIKTDGTGKQKLSDERSDHYSNIVDGWIYYSNGDDTVEAEGKDEDDIMDVGKLYRIKIDGTGKQKLNNDGSIGINVVGDRIFYINRSSDNKWYTMKTDGTGRQPVSDKWFVSIGSSSSSKPSSSTASSKTSSASASSSSNNSSSSSTSSANPKKEIAVDFYLKSVNKNIELNINWSDDFFSKSATVANGDLAIASLVLSENSYRKEAVEKTLKKLGFEDVKLYYDFKTSNRVAHAIARKKVVINSKLQNIVAVVCRGTDGFSEGISNIGEFLGLPEFKDASGNVAHNLEQYLFLHKIYTQDIKFLITGHSRGGAVANLLSADITTNSKLKNLGNENNVYAYCFASPNSVAQKERINNINIKTIANNNDCVPNLSGGAKHGIVVRFDPTSEMLNTFEKLTGTIYDSKSSTIKGATGFGFGHPHNTESYLAYLLQNRTLTIGSVWGVKIVKIKCPVDVEVYDSAGTLVGRVVKNAIDENIESDVFITLNEDEKYFQLPDNGDYTFKMVGTDDGLMNLSVDYTNPDTEEIIEQKEFKNVKLFNGKTMTSEIKADANIADAKLFVSDGDKITSEIMEDGTEIASTGVADVNASKDSISSNNKSPLTIIFVIALCVILLGSGVILLIIIKKRKKLQ